MFKLYSFVINFLIHRSNNWKNNSKSTSKNTLWFHASSSGELEILIPIIELAVKEEQKVCVSVFSSSAESMLKKLPSELLFCGYSPSEDQWQSALEHFGVSEVITAKYEAWPGLWRAASLLDIRISIICARLRSSLIWANRLLKLFGVAVPKLRFFVLEQNSIKDLNHYFPLSECIISSDPRWLRVIQRSENIAAHDLFQKWKNKYLDAKKPFWVIGSAWKEDMDILSESIRNYPGTVWVVPHSLKHKPDSNIFAPTPNCILVDEMGLLVELYSIADRAWVGGGFGEGIHSTLEPAVYSIPIASGPKNVPNFFETFELIEKGVLTICETPINVQDWLDTTSQNTDLSLMLKADLIQKMMRTILK